MNHHLLLLRLVRPKPNYTLRSFPFHSTRTLPHDTLQRRVARAGDPSASILRVLEGWLDEGNPVKTSELHSIVKMLRKFSRFSHALQVSNPQILLFLLHFAFFQKKKKNYSSFFVIVRYQIG